MGIGLGCGQTHDKTSRVVAVAEQPSATEKLWQETSRRTDALLTHNEYFGASAATDGKRIVVGATNAFAVRYGRLGTRGWRGGGYVYRIDQAGEWQLEEN